MISTMSAPNHRNNANKTLNATSGGKRSNTLNNTPSSETAQTQAPQQAKMSSKWAQGPPPSLASSQQANATTNAANAAPSVVNGIKPQSQPLQNASSKESASSKTRTSSEQSTAPPQPTTQKQMHDRLLFMLSNFVGSNVSVHTRQSQVYSGIFSSAPAEGDLGCALSMAKLEGETIGDGSDIIKSLVLGSKDVGMISCFGLEFNAVERDNSSKVGFQTDTAISGGSGDLRERNLVKWTPSEPISDALTLEPASGGWDQFAVNEKLFGVQSDYKEELYTTKLEKGGEGWEERERWAAKMAREIEGNVGGANMSLHIAEERGLVIGDDEIDEEERYSSVIRGNTAKQPLQPTGAPGKYVPPQRKTSLPKSTPAPQQQEVASVNKEENKNKDAAQDKKSFSAAVKDTISVPAPLQKIAHKTDGTPLIKTTPAQLSNDFSKFAQSERAKIERAKLEEKKLTVQKSRKSELFSDLKSFAESFKLTTPVPTDIQQMLKKDKSSTSVNTSASTTTSTTPQPAHEEPKPSKEDVKPSKPQEKKPVEQKHEEKKPEEKEKPKTKLNANAKSFTFNPSATAFVPSIPFTTTPPQSAPATPTISSATISPQQFSHGYGGTSKRAESPFHVRKNDRDHVVVGDVITNGFRNVLNRNEKVHTIGPIWQGKGKRHFDHIRDTEPAGYPGAMEYPMMFNAAPVATGAMGAVPPNVMYPGTMAPPPGPAPMAAMNMGMNPHMMHMNPQMNMGMGMNMMMGMNVNGMPYMDPNAMAAYGGGYQPTPYAPYMTMTASPHPHAVHGARPQHNMPMGPRPFVPGVMPPQPATVGNPSAPIYPGPPTPGAGIPPMAYAMGAAPMGMVPIGAPIPHQASASAPVMGSSAPNSNSSSPSQMNSPKYNNKNYHHNHHSRSHQHQHHQHNQYQQGTTPDAPSNKGSNA